MKAHLQANRIIPVDPERLTHGEAWRIMDILVKTGRAIPFVEWTDEPVPELVQAGLESFNVFL